MKSLRVCYWNVKMLRCGCVEHGLEYIMFYVKKHIAPLAVCPSTPLVRDKPLGELPFVKLYSSLIIPSIIIIQKFGSQIEVMK